MSIGYWDQVQATGFEVPSDRPLDDLTAELTTMLGSTRPEVRDGTAFPALATWIDRGIYDDLLIGLGDGMVAGLAVGLGESGTDTVFRRSFSALILAACIERDNERHLLPGAKILEWGDRAATWFLAEKDSRGWVPDKGWAHAVAHGADTIGALGESPHLAGPEHALLLDILAERVLLQPADQPLAAGEPDRIAAAVMQILRRNTLGARHPRAVGAPHRRGRQPVRRPASTTTPTRRRPAAGPPARALHPALPGARRRPPSGPTCCWSSSTRCGCRTLPTCE